MRKTAILFTLLLVLGLGPVMGQQLQKKTKENIAVGNDNRRLVKARKLDNRPVDTVLNLDAYIQMKADCQVTKSMDDDGSILMRYPDGYTRKFSNGVIIEVITPDGVRHVPRKFPYTPHMLLAVIQIPPPVPGINDPVYKWLAKFKSDLESDIREAIGGGDSRWSVFLSDESDACGDNIYKQIQFRASFLENYGKAK